MNQRSFNSASITGDNENGPIVLLNVAQDAYLLKYCDRYTPTMRWQQIKSAPFTPAGITGDNRKGVAVYNVGHKVAYIDDYIGDLWTVLNDAPFHITGMTGDNHNGVAVYNGQQVAYIDDYKGGVWTVLPDAPFGIRGITGDNRKGVAVYDDHQVAYIDDYKAGVWKNVPNVPSLIVNMTGNNAFGLVIHTFENESRGLWMIKSYASGQWERINYPGFPIDNMAGDPEKGVVCLIGDDSAVVFCDDWKKGLWSIVDVYA